jgi:hypothetical protein
MKRATWLAALVFVFSCAKVLPVYEVPPIVIGEPAFFPTIEALHRCAHRRRESRPTPVQRR